MNVFNIERSFKQKKERNWKHIYWKCDLHDTIIEGKYNLDNKGARIYPNAIEVLQYLSNRDDQKLILWTSSYKLSLKNVLIRFKSYNIHFDYFNENPDCVSTEL